MEEQVKILRAPLRISIAILIIGVMFKIMHWPFGFILIVLASIGIVTLCVFKVINLKERKSIDFIKILAVLLWCLCLIITVNIEFILIVFFSLITWFFLEVLSFLRLKRTKQPTKLFPSIILGHILAIVILGGVFFVVQWPGYFVMLVCALAFSSLYFLITALK